MPTLTGDAARPERFVPGQPDMWALVLFEAMFFTGYFTVYMVCRVMDPDQFLQSQAQLDPRWGVLNTLVMLTSSWCVARCVQQARAKAYPAALKSVFLTVALGLVFVGLKVAEWATEIQKGLTFTTNEFFSFYYFLTAIHFIHLLVGFVALGIVIHQLRSPGRRSQEIVETGATYWHLVDFLWVIIFALLYLMR
jgi:nitric oxide reductase NorE protein